MSETRRMTDTERESYPINALLNDWRRHCEVAHKASREDYGMNVQGWHLDHHPDCEWSAE